MKKIFLKPESYPENRVEKTRQLINQLMEVRIKVRQEPTMHEHYAIIDEEIAQKIMEITFGRNV